MGRYYKTNSPQKLDFMMKLPEQAMFMVADQEGKNSGNLKNMTGYLNGLLEGETHEKWKPQLEKIFNGYEDKVNEVANQIASSDDYYKQRESLPQIANLKRDIHTNLNRGPAAAMMKDYSNLQSSLAALHADKENNKADINALYNKYNEELPDWAWDENTKKGTSTSLGYIPGRFDMMKWMRENIDPTKMENLTERIGLYHHTGVGFNYYADKTGRRYTPTQMVQQLSKQGIIDNKEYQERVEFDMKYYGKTAEDIEGEVLRATTNYANQFSGVSITKDRYTASDDLAKMNTQYKLDIAKMNAKDKLDHPEKYALPIIVKHTELKEDPENFNKETTADNIKTYTKNIKEQEIELQEAIKSGEFSPEDINSLKENLLKSKDILFNEKQKAATVINYSFEKSGIKDRDLFDHVYNQIEAEKQAGNKAMKLGITSYNLYNVYKNNMLSKGKKPVSFQDYDNAFVNQKVNIPKNQDIWYKDESNNSRALDYMSVDNKSNHGQIMGQVINTVMQSPASNFKNSGKKQDGNLKLDISNNVLHGDHTTTPQELASIVSNNPELLAENGYHYRPNIENGTVDVIMMLDNKNMKAAGYKIESDDFAEKEYSEVKITLAASNMNEIIQKTYGDSPSVETQNFLRTLDPIKSQIDNALLRLNSSNTVKNPVIRVHLYGSSTNTNLTYDIQKLSKSNEIKLTLTDNKGNPVNIPGLKTNSYTNNENAISQLWEELNKYNFDGE